MSWGYNSDAIPNLFWSTVVRFARRRSLSGRLCFFKGSQFSLQSRLIVALQYWSPLPVLRVTCAFYSLNVVWSFWRCSIFSVLVLYHTVQNETHLPCRAVLLSTTKPKRGKTRLKPGSSLILSRSVPGWCSALDISKRLIFSKHKQYHIFLFASPRNEYSGSQV